MLEKRTSWYKCHKIFSVETRIHLSAHKRAKTKYPCQLLSLTSLWYRPINWGGKKKKTFHIPTKIKIDSAFLFGFKTIYSHSPSSNWNDLSGFITNIYYFLCENHFASFYQLMFRKSLSLFWYFCRVFLFFFFYEIIKNYFSFQSVGFL